MGFAAIFAAVAASQLVARLGTRTVAVGGAVLSVTGLLMLTRATATGDYLTELLPGFIVFGIGIMLVAVPGQILAVADVGHAEAGAASGVISSGYQVGGALGLAVITTFATSRVTELATQGVPMQDAVVAGFHRGLLIAAAFAAVNFAVSLVSPQVVPDAEQLLEATAAA